MSGKRDPLLDAVDGFVRQSPTPWQQILERTLEHFDCPLGTIHVLGASGELELVAQRGLPDAVVAKVTRVPIGRGMAGIAAERKEPVQVCNLQSDDSGVVRPGAKLTQMEGSIACPMLLDGDVRGVLGVAKPVPYEFTKVETDLLKTVGATLARVVTTGPVAG
ncbi:MAG: GAF domain-containing protein [Planctomycetota bacterium]